MPLSVSSQIQCPFCEEGPMATCRTIEVPDLLAEWRRHYEIDLASEDIAGVDSIDHVACGSCGFETFSPACPASGKVYEALQSFDWYYETDKWEFREADRYIESGHHVLEMGCGRGHFLERLGRRGVVAAGIELNEDAQAYASQRGLRVLTDPDAIASERFDVVCSFQVLEHVEDPRGFLAQGRDHLREGGLLIACVPNGSSFMRHDHADLMNQPPHHISRWTYDAFRRAADVLDLQIVSLGASPFRPEEIDWFAAVQVSRAARFGVLAEKLGWRLLAPAIRLATRSALVRSRLQGHDLMAVFRHQRD